MSTLKSKMSNSQLLLEEFLKQVYGSTILEEREKIERAMAETEAERQKTNAERQKADAERQKADTERQKAETERQNNIVRLFEIGNHSPSQISILLGLEPAYIDQVLKKKGLIV